MPSFGTRSRQNLAQLHPSLQIILSEAIKEFDFTILDAQRGRAEQELAFAKGFSKVHFGNSAHNYTPAVACDIVPWFGGSNPIRWNDLQSFKVLQLAVILPIAKQRGIPIRQGIDWNGDGNIADGWDAPHIELHPWRTWAKKSRLIAD